MFKLFKTGGDCDLRILAKALPIIKSKDTLNKYDFGGASENTSYENLDSIFKTKNRDDMKIIRKLCAIFSQIRENYKQTIHDKSKITVSYKDINSVMSDKELENNNRLPA